LTDRHWGVSHAPLVTVANYDRLRQYGKHGGKVKYIAWQAVGQTGVGITQTRAITFYHRDSIIKTNIAQYSATAADTVT